MKRPLLVHVFLGVAESRDCLIWRNIASVLALNIFKAIELQITKKTHWWAIHDWTSEYIDAWNCYDFKVSCLGRPYSPATEQLFIAYVRIDVAVWWRFIEWQIYLYLSSCGVIYHGWRKFLGLSIAKSMTWVNNQGSVTVLKNKKGSPSYSFRQTYRLILIQTLNF